MPIFSEINDLLLKICPKYPNNDISNKLKKIIILCLN